MILKVFTKGDDPMEREALAIAKRIEGDNYSVEYYDFENEESRLQTEIYNIYSTPALLITQDDGKFVEIWQNTVPLESDLKNFMRL